MLKMDAARSVLVLVDYQERLMPAIHEAPAVAVAGAAVVPADAVRAGHPGRGQGAGPGWTRPQRRSLGRRCDVTLPKMHFAACSDRLAELLTEGCAPGDRPQVVIAGCEALCA